jgi:hypothetical protein
MGDLIKKKKKTPKAKGIGAWLNGRAQLKALSSNPNTTKKEKKRISGLTLSTLRGIWQTGLAVPTAGQRVTVIPQWDLSQSLRGPV